MHTIPWNFVFHTLPKKTWYFLKCISLQQHAKKLKFSRNKRSLKFPYEFQLLRCLINDTQSVGVPETSACFVTQYARL